MSPFTTSSTWILDVNIPLLMLNPICSLTYGSDIKRCKFVMLSFGSASFSLLGTMGWDLSKPIICNGIDDFPSVFSSNCFCCEFQVTVPIPLSSPECLRFIQMSASVGLSNTAQSILFKFKIASGCSFWSFWNRFLKDEYLSSIKVGLFNSLSEVIRLLPSRTIYLLTSSLGVTMIKSTGLSSLVTISSAREYNLSSWSSIILSIASFCDERGSNL